MNDHDTSTYTTYDTSKSFFDRRSSYLLIAAIPAVLFAGIIDGGVTMAIAYYANILYDRHHGIYNPEDEITKKEIIAFIQKVSDVLKFVRTNVIKT